MRFILGITLIYGFVAQFATSGSHFRLFDTRKTIIFIGRAPSGCVENACNNAILRDNYWLYCCAIWGWSDNYKSHSIMMKHLNIDYKQNSWKKIKDIAIWPLRVYVYYKTRTSIIFNTFLCLSRKCRTKLIELFDFFIRVLFVTQNCLQWKLCWACFFLNTSCTVGSATLNLAGI